MELRHRIRQDGPTAHLSLDGEIDMRVAPQLRAILHEILENPPDELVVDLAGVPFIDSSGIATLVEALRMQRNSDRALRIENATESVRYTFKITQLTKVFGIVEPEEEQTT